MSGIAGLIHFDGAPVEPGLVERMTGAMHYRGPDGINHWVKGSVALGQCMLRTTPESLEEQQPLTNEDQSLVLVMDGRVDNGEELRQALLRRGAVLRNRSDAELVLRAYEAWGEDCPDRIIGEFVFFLWDGRKRCLFGARDAAGTRHFYYYVGKGWFGFASEIKGLLALDLIEPRLNESRLLDYLVTEFDRDDEVGTFYQNINRMPAGNAMCATERGISAWRYWNPGELSEIKFRSTDECAEAFREQLRIAVKCRLRSIGPVGSMLSGGLDSSAIVSLIGKEFRTELRQPLETFSLIREDRENCPDWQSIRHVLADSWFEPTIITSAIPRVLQRAFLGHIGNADEPFAFSHGLTNFLIYESARQRGCRVVLDGMAGDLLFYGFDRTLSSILQMKSYMQIPALLAAFRRHDIEHGARDLIRKALALAAPMRAKAFYRQRREKHPVLSDDLRLLHREGAMNLLTARQADRRLSAGHSGSTNDQADHARVFTSGLLSFAHEVYGPLALARGVEPRSPFSDRRIIEFAVRMPIQAKLSLPWYKHTLRTGMAGALPDAVRWRRDVGGHPGWRFYGQLIAELRHAPEIWSRRRIADSLSKWIDDCALTREWQAYDREAAYPAGFNLYKLAMLARWLSLESGGIMLQR